MSFLKELSYTSVRLPGCQDTGLSSLQGIIPASTLQAIRKRWQKLSLLTEFITIPRGSAG